MTRTPASSASSASRRAASATSQDDTTRTQDDTTTNQDDTDTTITVAATLPPVLVLHGHPSALERARDRLGSATVYVPVVTERYRVSRCRSSSTRVVHQYPGYAFMRRSDREEDQLRDVWRRFGVRPLMRMDRPSERVTVPVVHLLAAIELERTTALSPASHDSGLRARPGVSVVVVDGPLSGLRAVSVSEVGDLVYVRPDGWSIDILLDKRSLVSAGDPRYTDLVGDPLEPIRD